MKYIGGLGGVTVDIICQVPSLPFPDSVQSMSNYSMQQGGMVATALVTAARLGAPTAFIGGIGEDEYGHFIIDRFEKESVDIEGLQLIHEGASSFSIVLADQTTGKRSIVNHKGVQTLQELPEFPQLPEETSVFHTDTYWTASALEAAKEVKKQGGKIVLDISINNEKPELPEFFRLSDFCIPSLEFARRRTGKSDPFEAGRELVSQGCCCVVLTAGADGVYLVKKDCQMHLPAYPVEVIDSNGAGDVFHGAFLFALYQNYPLERALQFSSAVAAIKCTSLGGQEGIPTFEEAVQFLRNQGCNWV